MVNDGYFEEPDLTLPVDSVVLPIKEEKITFQLFELRKPMIQRRRWQEGDQGMLVWKNLVGVTTGMVT